ncbi:MULTISPECIES: AcrIF11 family anti-CRISPR ADP-ribosyltransferase [Dickeya]|uniref:Uncharacterized protein n=1 Tax=Dickeya poaceiphila TaxID=568768 RepID=A0A5B8I6B7_9GAMM|nr:MULTISPECIES: hypothetical protein [Dickeya]QDX29538.1 hypothetical protein Dpoa569_0001313 [Dickeya poaceiphila]WES88794.1 hypothetical protein PQ617_21740 [Dickeya fangzhongdai]
MKLFHGSCSTVAPAIKVGAFEMLGASENVFDGIFASGDWDAAASHGNGNIFTYIVDEERVAESRDLDANFEEIVRFLLDQYEINSENMDRVNELARAIVDDENQDDEFADVLLFPRLGSDIGGAYSWEIQRLRGRVAAHLGFDAVEMRDEHGTSYLIVNPKITAE